MLKKTFVNNQIRASQVTVIDDQGKQLGVMALAEALRIARERDLDLVEVGPNASPPITKIMDYGKYVYQQEKNEKKSAGKVKGGDLKTVRVGFKTGPHDLQFRVKQVTGFLNEGHRVKIELTLRGREKALADMGKRKLESFLQMITEPYKVQEEIKRSPFGWTVGIKK